MSTRPPPLRLLSCPLCTHRAVGFPDDLWCCLGCLAHGDALAAWEYRVLRQAAEQPSEWALVAAAAEALPLAREARLLAASADLRADRAALRLRWRAVLETIPQPQRAALAQFVPDSPRPHFRTRHAVQVRRSHR